MIRAFIAAATALFGRFSFCAKIGAIVGIIAGSFFALLQGSSPAATFAPQELLLMGIALALVGWLFVLLAVGIWLRYGAAAIAGPALLNALITAILTVLVCDFFGLPALDWIFGLVIGLLVGTLLCRLCERWPVFLKGAHHD